MLFHPSSYLFRRNCFSCSDAILVWFCRTKFWLWNLGIWELMCWTSKHQIDKSGCLPLWGSSNSLRISGWIFSQTLWWMCSIPYRSNFEFLHCNLMPLDIFFYFFVGGTVGKMIDIFMNVVLYNLSLFFYLWRYTPLSWKSNSKAWELLSIIKCWKWSRFWLVNYGFLMLENQKRAFPE